MASEFSYELRVPKDRVAVIIGQNGSMKMRIERATNTSLSIDSNEGLVEITGEDALGLYTTREIIRAIGRGFNPDIALQLLKQDYGFELVPITNYAKTPGDALRLKGRVIGEGGKSRRTIEELTNCNLCVYGKTIAIIGEFEGLTSARRAIESLLAGSPHAAVYKSLERRRKEIKRRELIGE